MRVRNYFSVRTILLLAMAVFVFPAQLLSQQNLSIIYTSPVESSQWHNCETNIILKFNRPVGEDELKSFGLFISGSDGLPIQGSFFQAAQTNIMLFEPASPFAPGERVNVLLNYLNPVTSDTVELASFYFDVKTKNEIIPTALEQEIEFVSEMATSGFRKSSVKKAGRGSSELPESFPKIEIDVNNNPQNGFYFLNSFFAGGTGDPAYTIIFDSVGFPVFYRKFVQQVSAFFFQEETGTLTYWDNGLLLFVELDSAYQIINNYTAKNGYITDGHELILKIDGSYWIIALDFQIVDMSQIVPGGDTAAIVEGIILQQIDASGNVIFQWRSWDHFSITDADPNIVDLTLHRIDYVHTNAIHFDWDGHLLISSRNMSEITKINYTTGNIMWRWGGSNNEFVITGDDPVFLAQHDIRYIGDSLYTLFDNGISDYRPFSRGLVFQLNQSNKTGTLEHDFRDSDTVFSRFMGSMRQQENGNYLVGWSGNALRKVVTEYKPNGQKVFEMKSVDTAGLVSYRGLKYDWETSMFNISENQLDFGDVSVGDSVLLEISVNNNGEDEIEINGFHTIDSVFSVETTLPQLIQGGESRQFDIKFKPITDTAYQDVLSMIYDTDDTRVASQVRVLGGGLITDINLKNDFRFNLQVRPNPAHGLVAIRYQLPTEAFIRIELYDVRGQWLKTLVSKTQSAGKHEYPFDTTILIKGIYLLKMSITNGAEQNIGLVKFLKH